VIVQSEAVEVRLTFDELEGVASRARRDSKPPYVRVRLPGGALAVATAPPPNWQSRFELRGRASRAERGYLLAGHGDGLHLLLGDSCLCGARVSVGTDSAADGCRAGGACRKSRAVRCVKFAANMRGDVCFLLSCNSANLAAQLGSPGLSLAWTLLEAGFSKVVASTRQVIVNRRQIAVIEDSWMAGDSVENIVQNLNDLPEVDGAYVLLVPAGGDEAEEHPDASSNLPRSFPTRAPSQVKRLRAIEEVILAAVAHVGANSALGRRLAEQGRLISGLATLETRAYFSAATPQADLRDRIHRAIRTGWEHCVEEGLLGSGSGHGDVLQKAMIGRARLAPSSSTHSGRFCAMCSGTVWQTTSGVAQRWLISWCSGCGVKRASAQGDGPATFLDVHRPVLAGERHLVRLPMSDETTSGTVFVQVRDKSRRVPVVEQSERFEERPSDVLFAVPGDAGPDIGSVRVVIFGTDRLAYLREVFEIERSVDE